MVVIVSMLVFGVYDSVASIFPDNIVKFNGVGDGVGGADVASVYKMSALYTSLLISWSRSK